MAGYTIPTDNGLGGTTPSRLKLNTHQNPIKKADPYPGLDEATKLKITQEVNANYTSDIDRNIAANKLYKQYLTEATNKQLMADRQQARLELTAGSITAKNPIEKQKLSTIGTMSDMANVIRDAYMKDGVDLTQKSDQDILTKFATNNPELSAGMEDIINNNGDAIEWAKSVGLKERTGWDKIKDLVGSVAETIRKGGEGMESLIDKANNFLGADNERQSASFRNYMESKYSYADMWNMSKEQKDAEYQYYLDHKKELERSTSQDILDFAVGATDVAFWETAPLLTAGFTLAGNAEQLTENTMLEGVGEKVTGATEVLGNVTSVFGEIAGYLPGLSQFKNSLDEQGQQEFDSYVGNLVTMLVLHYGPKMARNGYDKFVNKPKKLNITSEGAKINPEGPTGPTGPSNGGPKGPTEGGPTDIATENIKSAVASELKPNEQAIIDAFKKFKETGAGADTIADKVLLFGKDAKGSIESAIKPALRVTKGAKENARVTERLDTMTRDLVKKGYKWETITEYKNAVMTEMGKMWGKVEGAVKDNAGLSISTEQLVNTCREYAAELRKTGKMDAVKAAEKMEQQASIWEEMGEISMDALEKLKQDNNSDANYRNSESSHYDDNLMKKINKNVGKMQEEILAKAESNTTLTPEEFSELKRMRGTYADLLGDINKAEIRQMRKTTSLGDQLNTVQSFGDAIGSSNNMIGAVWNGVKRVGKKVVNDAYERTRDADFLARRAWEKYYEEINGKKPEGKFQKSEGEGYGVANESERTITAEEGLNAKGKQGKSSAEILEQYGVPVETVEFLKTPEGRKAYGVYSEGKVKLAEQLKEGTVPHETLHAVFDLVDNVRKKSLIKEIMKEKNISESQANEFIADSFSEYFRTGKMPGTSGFRGGVKSFFQKVKEFVTGKDGLDTKLQNLYNDIIEGKDLGGEIGEYSDPRFQRIGVEGIENYMDNERLYGVTKISPEKRMQIDKEIHRLINDRITEFKTFEEAQNKTEEIYKSFGLNPDKDLVELKNKVVELKKLIDKGTSDEEITNKTFFEKGADGKWGLEVDDIILKDEDLKNFIEKSIKRKVEEQAYFDGKITDSEWVNRPYKLEKVLEQSEGGRLLLDIYGYDLGKLRVDFEDTTNRNYDGMYNGNQIIVSYKDANGLKTTDQILSALNHEVQHAIQRLEGFGEGDGGYFNKGNDRVFDTKAYKMISDGKLIDKINQKLGDNKYKYGEGLNSKENDYRNFLHDVVFHPEEIKNLLKSDKEGLKMLEDVVKSLSLEDIRDIRFNGISGYESYYRALGEVDARNTEKRMKLSPEQRRKTSRSETMDRTERQQNDNDTNDIALLKKRLDDLF